jgi:hypothetical protein
VVGIQGEDGSEKKGGDVFGIDVPQGIIHLFQTFQVGEVDC